MLRLLVDSKVSLEGCRSRQVKMFRVPKIVGTILGVLKTRIIVFGGLHWDPPILGNYHMNVVLETLRTFKT